MIKEIISTAISLSFVGGGVTPSRPPSYSDEYGYALFNVDEALVYIDSDYQENWYSVPIPNMVPIRDSKTFYYNSIVYKGVTSIEDELYVDDSYYTYSFYQEIENYDHSGVNYSIDLVSSSNVFFWRDMNSTDLTVALLGNGAIYNADITITCDIRGIEVGTTEITSNVVPFTYTHSISTEPSPLITEFMKSAILAVPNSTSVWELMNFKAHIQLSSEQIINDRIGLLINQSYSTDNMPNYYIEELYLLPYELFSPGMPTLNFSAFLIESVGGFLDTELWPGFSLGGMLSVCVSIGIFVLILKMFVGG